MQCVSVALVSADELSVGHFTGHKGRIDVGYAVG